MKIAFVILHYENINDTNNCVSSILEQNKIFEIKYKIYILDNASPNKSGDLLQKQYKNHKKIEVIKLSQNYGFSKANNIGYAKAKEWGANVIAVLDNDILIEDKYMIEKTLNIYNKEKTNVAIIAPDIINRMKYHQNPLRKDAMTIKTAYKNLLFNYLLLFGYHIPILNKKIYQLNKKRTEKWFNKYYQAQTVKNMENIVPHGAFVLFLPKWIIHENQAFPCNTFMYLEEDFLKKYCEEKRYLIKYVPLLKVKHLEGRSVSAISKSEFLKHRFKIKKSSEALKKYILFLKEKR